VLLRAIGMARVSDGVIYRDGIEVTTLSHISSSFVRCAWKSAALPLNTVPPSDARRLLIKGRAVISLANALIFSTIASGVSAGAKIPHQVEMSKSSMPDSSSVGTSGNKDERSLV